MQTESKPMGNTNNANPVMESWRHVWRKGFSPQMSTHSLEELLKALLSDDVRLLQGATTSPPPLMNIQDWPVEACCAVSFCGFADGLETVGECEEFFARLCYQCDNLLGETAGTHWFLNWYDETPRDEMRVSLSEEIRWELSRRKSIGNCEQN